MIVSHDTKNEILNIFLEELSERDRLIDEYRHKPLEFLAKKGSYYPPFMADMFMDIYSILEPKSLWLAPRGGGKTYDLGDIGATMFLFKDFDVLISSGSEDQARAVYERVMDILDDGGEVAEYAPQITKQITRGKKGNWIMFVPASTKRVRGPHPGQGSRGGLIILDEEAEMDEAIVKAIMGTGGTAKPLVIIRASTAHEVDGTFAELLDDYEKKGYKLYNWDVFDVCEKCTRDCKKCIPEFRDEYCCGKAKNNSSLGWVSLDYIFSMWYEMDRDWFEVELMSSRIKGAGFVIERDDLKAAIVKECPYTPGAPGAIGIDWGFKGMCAAVATQRIFYENKPVPGMIEYKIRLIDRMSFHLKGIGEIAEALKIWRDMYDMNEVFADSSHPFENDYLRKEGFIVVEVTFVSFKEAGAGAVRGFFEKRRFELPEEFKDVKKQLKGWKRDKHGKIVKKDDHFPDAILCTMWKWWKKMRRQVGYMKVTR